MSDTVILSPFFSSVSVSSGSPLSNVPSLLGLSCTAVTPSFIRYLSSCLYTVKWDREIRDGSLLVYDLRSALPISLCELSTIVKVLSSKIKRAGDLLCVICVGSFKSVVIDLVELISFFI